MLGVELVSDKQRKTPDAKLTESVQDKMLERGFLVGVGGFYGNVLRIQPPLVIDDADLDRGLAALDEILDAA
jgi:4-aminobutyrate aminotransferase-like enzyme